MRRVPGLTRREALKIQ
jgi:hypothetical protein